MSGELYRAFDNEGVLLYVGISFSAIGRLKDHMVGSAWFNDVKTITIERYGDRETLLMAERTAIYDEKPLYNVVHNKQNNIVKAKKINAQLLNLTRVAVVLKCNRRTMYNMMRDGRFDVRPTPPHIKPHRWLLAHIEAFKNSAPYPKIGD